MPSSACLSVLPDARQHATASLAACVGQTPLVTIDTPFTLPGQGFVAKLEGHNPGGLKDRAALHMVAQARRRGDLALGAPIIESSSGTLGLGLALAGIVHDHPVTIVSDPGLEPFIAHLLRAYGAQVEPVLTPATTGGWQQARKNRVATLLTETPGAWSPNQYDNPDNITAYNGLAHELLDQLDRIDVLVTAVGTGGHSAGVARELRTVHPGLRLIGVDSIGSVIFGQPPEQRLMRGLGSSIFPRNVDYPAFDEVHWVAPGEAAHVVRQLGTSHYATGGWSVGAVALVARWAAAHYPRDRVVAIFPDGPHRYWNTLFNPDYLRQHRLDEHAPASEPNELRRPHDRVATSWTRCATVVDPRDDRAVA